MNGKSITKNSLENNKLLELKTRTITLKKSNGYIVPSKGMISSWKLEINQDFRILIDDINLNTPRIDKNIVSISEIRNYIRNLDLIEEPHEVELQRFENYFCVSQLYGTKFYLSLSNDNLFNSLFTRDMKIQLFFDDGPDEVNVEETYWDRLQSQD